MKLVYKCDWCKTMGTEEEILEHEKTCALNTNLHTCYTCANRKRIAAIECKVGISIPENHYIQHCDKWEEGKHLDLNSPMENFFDTIFGMGKTE